MGLANMYYSFWQRKHQEREIISVVKLGSYGTAFSDEIVDSVNVLEAYELSMDGIYQQVKLMSEYFDLKLSQHFWVGSVSLTEKDLNSIISNLRQARFSINETALNIKEARERGVKLLITEELMESYRK